MWVGGRGTRALSPRSSRMSETSADPYREISDSTPFLTQRPFSWLRIPIRKFRYFWTGSGRYFFLRRVRIRIRMIQIGGLRWPSASCFPASYGFR